MKKVWKTTRPFGYDLNQILYNYTVEVTNRSKGLDLIDRVPEERWTEVHDTVQEAGIKTIPKWVLGDIPTNKASRGDGIPAELFQILKDDAVKVL